MEYVLNNLRKSNKYLAGSSPRLCVSQMDWIYLRRPEHKNSKFLTRFRIPNNKIVDHASKKKRWRIKAHDFRSRHSGRESKGLPAESLKLSPNGNILVLLLSILFILVNKIQNAPPDGGTKYSAINLNLQISAQIKTLSNFPVPRHVLELTVTPLFGK